MTVQIENEATKDLKFDYENTIRVVVEEAIEHQNCPYETEVNVVLTNDKEIQEINKEFRDIDRATDVLSFPAVDFTEPANFDEELAEEYFHPETGELILGDIMISVDKIYEQAENYGHSQERELAFLVAHSMLHLFGYDHMEEEERIVMERLQEEILQNLNITRA